MLQKVQGYVVVLRVDSRLYCSAAPAFFAFCEGEKRTFRLTSYCHVSMLIQLGLRAIDKTGVKAFAVSRATFYTDHMAFVG